MTKAPTVCRELSRVLIPTPLLMSVHSVATKLSPHLLLLVASGTLIMFLLLLLLLLFCFVLFLSTCYFQGIVLCGDRRESYIFLVLQVYASTPSR